MTARWRLVPHFLLRRAGFAFRLLEQVRFDEVARLAVTAAGAEAAAEALRAQLLGAQVPAEVRRLARLGDRDALRRLSRFRRRVGRQGAAPLPEGPFSTGLRDTASALLAARDEAAGARAAIESAIPAELFAARKALRRLFRRPDCREALFLLSVDLVEAMERTLDAEASSEPPAAERALERRLYAFLQRLCSKNETTSFFGPMAYGQVDASVERTTFGPETPSGVSRRETFATFWAAAAFGRAAHLQPAVRQGLPVRRVPVTRLLDGEFALSADGKRVSLTALQRRLYEASDGRRTARELAERIGADPAESERAVFALEKALLVQRGLEPLSTTPHPLQSVCDQLPASPEAEPIRQGVEAFLALLEQFGAADLPGRRRLLTEVERLFTEVTGQPARRAAGQTYADRAVLYEDCLGDLQPVRMAPSEAASLEDQLTPALELGARYGALRAASLRALATEVCEALGGEAPFLEFAATLDARIAGGALRERDAPAQGLLERLASLVRRASDGRVARLAPDEVTALAPGVTVGRFASPDVMLHAEHGRVRYVIGEVHPYVYAWGSQGYFAPDKARLMAAFQADLSPWGGAQRIATVLRRRKHKGLLSDAFPGTFIEVTGRASSDPERCVAIADLRVRRTEAGAELFGPRGPLTLYVGEDDHPHLRAFAPPLVEIPSVRLGRHTPRIEVGELVLQRERWQLGELAPGTLPAGDAAQAEAEERAAERTVLTLRRANTPAALAVAVAAARARHGWPAVLFAMAPSEPKPLCLDLEVPFAQQLLQRLVSVGRLTVSEMAPTPEALWVRRAEGGHTSELRMALIRDP